MKEDFEMDELPFINEQPQAKSQRKVQTPQPLSRPPSNRSQSQNDFMRDWLPYRDKYL